MAATPGPVATATTPWVFSRSERSTDLARPFSRSSLAAASKSPSVSSRARLASIIPAPVAWRRFWTSLAVNDMGGCSWVRAVRGDQPSVAGASASALGARRRRPAPRLGGRGSARRLGDGRLGGRGLGDRRLDGRAAAGSAPPAARRASRSCWARSAWRRASACSAATRASSSSVRSTAGAAAAGAAAGGDEATLLDGVGDHAAHEAAGADGVVVAGDDVLDDVGVAVGVDHGDDRDAELVGLGDADVLLLRVQDEHGVGQALHLGDAAEVALELLELAAEEEGFLLGHGVELAGGPHAAVLLHLGDALADGLEVGEHAAEPALVDVRHADLLGVALDRVLRLLLRADEQHGAASTAGPAGSARSRARLPSTTWRRIAGSACRARSAGVNVSKRARTCSAWP